MCRLALSTLKRFPGSTAAELDRDFVAMSGVAGDGQIRKRLNDLRKSGFARVDGTRKCRVTGRIVQVWWPSDGCPCEP